MPVPTEKSLMTMADEFYNTWNFSHCIGSIDGKHIRIQCPTNSGSMFFNYKMYFSVVLQAAADAHCRFTTIDVGGYGKQSDGGTFQVSDLYRAFKDQILEIQNFPPYQIQILQPHMIWWEMKPTHFCLFY